MHVSLSSRIIYFLALLLCWYAPASAAKNEIEVTVEQQDFYVTQYPATGEHLILWIASGYGANQRSSKISEKLSRKGIEVWQIDLAESLFLPKTTSTMRSFSGNYVASLVEAAHIKTGKKITLLTRSYGALPLLKGARVWQQRHQQDQRDYLNGAILFSPELYETVPALGLPPVYSDITFSTNIPIVIYQAGKRGNRWQLSGLLENLRKGGSELFLRITQGVIGFFYLEDTSKITQKALQSVPTDILRDIRMLSFLSVPKTISKLSSNKIKSDDNKNINSQGLDINLKAFKGNTTPLPLDLMSVKGELFKRNNYLGKVTVVNFWASWCPPCVEEIPSLNNLRKKMQGKPFELISVNYAERKDVIQQFLKEVNVDFPVLLDESGRVSSEWRVLVYPSTFVIGPSGKIKYGVNGAIPWDSPDIIKQLSALMANQ